MGSTRGWWRKRAGSADPRRVHLLERHADKAKKERNSGGPTDCDRQMGSQGKPLNTGGHHRGDDTSPLARRKRGWTWEGSHTATEELKASPYGISISGYCPVNDAVLMRSLFRPFAEPFRPTLPSFVTRFQLASSCTQVSCSWDQQRQELHTITITTKQEQQNNS